jgi:hypothetical protein
MLALPLSPEEFVTRRNSAGAGNDPNSMIDASLTRPAPGRLAEIHSSSRLQRNLRGRHAAVRTG